VEKVLRGGANYAIEESPFHPLYLRVIGSIVVLQYEGQQLQIDTNAIEVIVGERVRSSERGQAYYYCQPIKVMAAQCTYYMCLM
jgi:hypothetical protein